MNSSHIPTHLGLILDGNRRWAREQGLPQLEGHRRGYENLKMIARRAFEHGTKYISAYVFSTENWDRTAEEVGYLMNLLRGLFTHDARKLHAEGVRVLWLGSPTNVAPDIITAIRETEELTKDNTKGTLCLCFNYGGHREIAEGVQRIVTSGLSADQITDQTMQSFLYHPEIPPLDFVIRTSGEMRLSNFMLYRAAYAELYFEQKHWPAFTKEDLDVALAEYASRQRRFGK
jgi:undecaprenyl diphosphate synthase